MLLHGPIDRPRDLPPERSVPDDGVGSSVGAVSVMRRQQWTSMDETARAALFGRGLDDIFDPDLRASIGTLIDDVRDRGDEAVCDALRKFDGIDLEPDQLRVSPAEIADAIVSDAVDAALDDAITHLRRFNQAQMERGGDWRIESEPSPSAAPKVSRSA